MFCVIADAARHGSRTFEGAIPRLCETFISILPTPLPSLCPWHCMEERDEEQNKKER